MARRKIRNYDSVKAVEQMFDEAFDKYHDEIIADLLKEVKMNSLDEVREFEYKHCGWGMDCGWVKINTKNNEQAREWRLDGGNYSCAYVGRTPYNTQSTTLTKIQADWVIKKLGLNGQYYASVRLD